jgi:predicted ATPase/DNA-binding winged helix-turn-helix (wHTH) protein
VTAIYRFGRFELSPATRQFLVDNQPTPLGARAFDVLQALIERRERLVTKEELLDLAWPGVVVEENNLQVQISALRKLLGADAIATVAGRGYRFTLEPTHSAPAPPPSQGPKHNLPAQTTPFIGREDAIRAVKGILSNTHVRLLTLSGVGGTGKTRLALQATAEMVDEFEQGVYFVPLAALSDAALVLPTIAKVFDVREVTGRPLQEQLQDYLREKQMLLVLDNFEQVIDAAPRITDLLTAAPRLKVLVTSREVLRLSGETNYPVPPLSLPDPKRLPPLERFTQYDAVKLFIERALAVKPAFAVTNQNAAAVVEICHRLEGLPLAIELAAARVRVLPPQRMLVELSHRLSFLIGGARDLPARQKTLRSTIDWSHALLTGDEQQLFRRLAVFVGGCALEAIEAICNIEPNLSVLETVESLVGKSLVKQTEARGEPRFAMLETIREYARDRLIAAGDEERVRERHRDYFLSLAEQAEPKLMGAEQGAWLQRLEEEYENLRAGLDWSLIEVGSGGSLRLCGALHQFWFVRGHHSEGREWCLRALGKTGAEERTSERAKALNVAGVLARRQGDYPAARALGEESLAIQRQLGDRRGMATSLHDLGNVAMRQGDFASARALYEESLSISRELGDRAGIGSSLNDLGNVAMEHSFARALYEESLAISRELGDRMGIASELHNLGRVAMAQGDIASARALFEESLAISRELGNRMGISHSLAALGTMAFEKGDYPAAGALYEESLAISRNLGNRLGIAHTLDNLGEVAFEQRDYPAARKLYEQGLVIWRELGNRAGIANSLEGLAPVVAALGDSLRAARLWGAAERLREEIGSSLPPNERPQYDRCVVAARAVLKDDAAFDRAWQEGGALTLKQAMELALEKDAGAQSDAPVN